MQNLGWYNGTFGPIEDILVPMNDRACYFGDGIYDATYARGGIIFDLKAHVDRFYRSAGLIDLELPMTKDELTALLKDMIKKLDDGDLFVYWQATRGTAPRNHAYPVGAKANLWLMLRPGRIKDITQKIKLLTVPDTRFFHCNAKTLNLLPNVMAAQKAELAGCDEAVLHRDGRVTEGSHTNVHIFKDGALITAPADELILPGISRANLIAECRAQGVPVHERPFTVEAMMDADEVIISSVSTLCMAAEAIDGQPVGGKAPELLASIQRALLNKYIRETTENTP